VRQQLERILESPDFDASRRSREFLRFVIEETLRGRGASISQSTIATQVFGRRDDFDPVSDPIVRIQAGRLRRSLERYYLLAGHKDPVRIELPRGAYLPRFGATVVEPEAPAAQIRRHGRRATDEWPSVVVLPFDVTGLDPDRGGLANQFDEELAAELGRYRELRVLRQADREKTLRVPLRAHFTLSGAVRAVGEGLELTARLVDGASGEQLWAESQRTAAAAGGERGSPADAARVIAARVGSEEGIVVQTLAARTRQGGFGDSPYGAVLRSYDLYLRRDDACFEDVLGALRRVVAQSPEPSLAWSRLARLYMANYAFEISNAETPIDAAVDYAQSGTRLDPGSRRALCVLGAVLLVKGELGAALEQAEAASGVAPGSLVYLETIGWLLTLAGDFERGPALVREAVERNPYHLPHAAHALWLDALQRGDHAAAYQAALEYQDSVFFWRSLMRACSLGHLGRTSEAKREVAELLESRPGFAARGRILISRFVKRPDLQERVAEGLARAGLRLA
jgi:TolB-like protein